MEGLLKEPISLAALNERLMAEQLANRVLLASLIATVANTGNKEKILELFRSKALQFVELAEMDQLPNSEVIRNKTIDEIDLIIGQIK